MADEKDYDEELAFEADHPQDMDEVVEEPETDKPAKGTKYRVLFTSPFGRVGDIVTLNSRDRKVKHLLSIGGLEKV